ncbi:phage tail protein [Acinetobacter sp. B5B]|uniref:phage tail protein n=1 Tax=Acinetobacter baretiae TaxID=2605383 RepID=UPI0018C1E5DD|nr:phage tail protein [Acinetobacter baretiae]MBF7683864.1 phage tail protein [Acinetobacter baretiae]
MKKPNSLRSFLLEAIPELQNDPDRLLIFVDEGSIKSTMANGLSFEYNYRLKMILTDYAGDLAAVSIPVLDWVRINQSELLANLDKVHDGIKFEAEILANDKVDLVIDMPLTERVIVKKDQNQLSVNYPDEPQYSKAEPKQKLGLIDQKTGQVISSWMSSEQQEIYTLDMPYPSR